MSTAMSQLDTYAEKGVITPKLRTLIREFYDNYQKTLASFPSQREKGELRFEKLLALVIENIQHPYSFPIFHKSIRHPFDYYQFGLEFIRPFIDFENSKVYGLDVLKTIQNDIKKGENVILLANHQTEPDAQIISLLLEKFDPQLAANMIFIAGHRVITDPMAIPMSLGQNLLCIYSKKHMLHPPEEKAKKILHNQKTLTKMQELLNEGGCCIFVAPSGGRDRPNSQGEIDVAPFDSQSTELFWLMGKRATSPTHFYPLALQTYHLMPPPLEVEKEIGEKRIINISPVFLAFGKELERNELPVDENQDKSKIRHRHADEAWKKVRELYHSFPNN